MGDSPKDDGDGLFDFVHAVDSQRLNKHLASRLTTMLGRGEVGVLHGNYAQNLRGLRLAAQMLALIAFDHLIASPSVAPASVEGHPDVNARLAAAAERGQLIVSLPWVIAYIREVNRCTGDLRCWDQYDALVHQLRSIHHRHIGLLMRAGLSGAESAACTFIVELIGSLGDVLGCELPLPTPATPDTAALGGVDLAFGDRIDSKAYEECLGYTHAIRRLVSGKGGGKSTAPTKPLVPRKIIPEQGSQSHVSTDKAELARILQEAFFDKCKYSIVVGLVSSNVKSTVVGLRRQHRFGVTPVMDGGNVSPPPNPACEAHHHANGRSWLPLTP